MATGEFSAEMCETLHKVPKSVASRIAWKPNGDGVFVFQAVAITPDGIGLDLSGYFDKNGRHGRRTWGFSLRYHKNLIRSYDMSSSHKNPGEVGRIKGPHKHRFSSSKIDRYAYKPDPPISEEDPNAALLDFLAESNIQLQINYQHFIFP